MSYLSPQLTHWWTDTRSSLIRIQGRAAFLNFRQKRSSFLWQSPLSNEGVLTSNFITYVLSDECCILETAIAKQPFRPRLHYRHKDDVFYPPHSIWNFLQNENDVLIERSSISLWTASKMSPLPDIHCHSRETHTLFLRLVNLVQEMSEGSTFLTTELSTVTESFLGRRVKAANMLLTSSSDATD